MTNAKKFYEDNVVNNPTFLKVGVMKENDKDYTGDNYVLYNRKLVVDYDQNFPENLRKELLTIVYLMCVNGEVKKIGQTSGKGGISDCLSFYGNAGQDDPGNTRFAINALIREEIKKGNEVEVYIKYEKPIEVDVEGFFTQSKKMVCISAKGMEEQCVEDYESVIGSYPKWNFQESGESLPQYITESYANYKMKRAKAKRAKSKK